MGERRTTLGKAYAINMWYYWEHIEELFNNLIGSYWGQPKKSFLNTFPKAKEKGKN
jgi:hypothetical protein